MQGIPELDSVERRLGPGAARAAPDQHYRSSYEGRKSLDEYSSYGGTPSYGATPRATPKTPSLTPSNGDAPRRSASSIMKSLGMTSGRKSARLSDADDLQKYSTYYDDTISARMSNASPLRDSLSIAGPVQIPGGGDFYADVEAARVYAVEGNSVEEGFDCIDLEIGKPVRDEKPPLIRISLKFTDVRYKAVLKQPAKWRGKTAVEKEILHGITGSVAAGEMLAMMGPSGSGKTTLLNVLTGRKSNPLQISGSILYNNMSYTKNLNSRTGFVTQDDVLFPHLTVRETLVCSALLRLPKWLTKQQKVERAEDVTAQLGLQKCRDTVIGNQFLRGVSGGERKRVCIGQEILIDPSLIFLDEPTSGLDSTTALRLIQLLQKIAHVNISRSQIQLRRRGSRVCELDDARELISVRNPLPHGTNCFHCLQQGRTVVTTIHQPSSRAFHMFDKLILLSEGHSIYYGKARGAMTYFDSICFSPLIPMNPADFLLDLCSGNTNDISLPLNMRNGNQMQMQKPNGSVPPATPSTVLAKDVKQYLVECCENQISSVERTKPVERNGTEEGFEYGASEKATYGTTWWEQFTILLIRGLKERKHEYLSSLRTIQVVLSAFLTGCLWWQSKHGTAQELQDQVGLIFFIAVFWGYLPLFTAIFTFPLERAVLAKERGSHMYRLSAYFMARTLGDLPLDLALPFLFMIIIYFMTGLQRSASAFLFSILTVFLTVIASQGVGLFIGAVMMDVQRATTFASVLILAFMLTGGFFVKHIPPFVAWIKQLSFQAHTYEILVQLQYGHEALYNCASAGGCKSIASAPALDNTSLHGFAKPVLALLAMVFGYRILAYVALRRMRTHA